MEQKPIEIQIQDKIDEAINAYNKDDDVTYIQLCDEIEQMIIQTYGRPVEIDIGLFREKGELKYAKPTLHNILKQMKYEAYYDCSKGIYVDFLICFFHSCLALHYFEILEKVPDELRGNQHEYDSKRSV